MILSSYNNLYLFIKRHFNNLLPFLNFVKLFNGVTALLEMAMRKERCHSFPLIYRIDPCTQCNLKCPPCTSWQTNTKEKRMMEYSDYKVIIDKVKKYALRASLYDMGEPLLNKDIYKMIKYASNNNISTLISTNFNLFNRNQIKDLFESRLTVLEPCLDSFTQKNYEIYRRGGNVQLVKNNIKSVMEYKLKNKFKYPIVDVQIINFKYIKNEIPLINKFLKRNKVDKITYRKDIYDFNTDIITEVKSNRKTCFWLYLGMMIRPDGNVYPCCGKDFNRFSYGNILSQNLEDIWNNEYYRFSRKLFKRGKNLSYNKKMKNIPCLTCNNFTKLRIMKKDCNKNPLLRVED
jgi:radical SAM protein with 4Fe4S-binding SPASM domain